MTKKENLYFELLKIKDEVSMKQYNHTFKAVSAEEFVNAPKFRREVDAITVAKIEEETRIWKKMLDEIRQKESVAQWLESEAGLAYVKERKDKIDALWDANRAIIREGRKHVSEVIKGFLGDQWDVTRFSDGHMEVAIVEKYTEDGCPVGLFGHEFEVYFGHDWRLTKEGPEEYYRWEMNYGAMGAFDLFESSTRAQHLIGMGRFAGDTEVVPQLKDYLQKMSEETRRNEKVIDGLEKEIKNPVIG